MRKWIQWLWSSLQRLAAGGRQKDAVPPPAVAAWELRLLALQQEISAGTERAASRLDDLQRILTTVAEHQGQADAQAQAAHADLLTRLDAAQAALDRATQAHAEATRATLGELQSDLAGAMHDLRTVLTGLQENVDGLDRQLGRAGREQLKANTLFESQQQQTQAALDQLRDLDARREAELVELRSQLRREQAAARLKVVERLLPVLDGLNEARTSGQRLVERAPEPQPTPPTTFGARLAQAFGLRPRPAALATDASDIAQLKSALDAWLRGLAFVEERLLEVLATEGVYPIPTQGELFDPHQHVAVDTLPATDGILPGTIVAEFRRGYTVGEHVLRPAEVVVAKEIGGIEET